MCRTAAVVVAIAVVLLFVYVCLRVLVCSVIVEACGARSRVRDASHRRQHCCASIEDRACCGVKLHLAACCSWVGRWDGGLGAAYYCCAAGCCMSLPLLLLLFVFACLCLLARVGVLGHRRGMALGHACGMTPTGANICCAIIKDLACCGFNLHLAAF